MKVFFLIEVNTHKVLVHLVDGVELIFVSFLCHLLVLDADHSVFERLNRI
jgi:hypothetical protein